jgi:hypothetical protein
VSRHTQFLRPGLVGLALGVGFGGIAGGCGGTAGPGTTAQNEKVPEGVVQMKNFMKGRAAEKKGHPGGPGRAPSSR